MLDAMAVDLPHPAAGQKPPSRKYDRAGTTDGATIVVDDLLAKVTFIRNAVILSFR